MRTPMAAMWRANRFISKTIAIFFPAGVLRKRSSHTSRASGEVSEQGSSVMPQTTVARSIGARTQPGVLPDGGMKIMRQAGHIQPHTRGVMGPDPGSGCYAHYVASPNQANPLL